MSSVLQISLGRNPSYTHTREVNTKVAIGHSLITAVAATAIAAATCYGAFAVPATGVAILLGIIAVLSGVVALDELVSAARGCVSCYFSQS